MGRRAKRVAAIVVLGALAACSREEPARKPPPLPVLTEPAADPAGAEGEEALAPQADPPQAAVAKRPNAKQPERAQKRAASAPTKQPAATRGQAAKPAPKPAAAKPAQPAPTKTAQPTPVPAKAASPTSTPAPRPAQAVAGRVRVPSTAHVRAEVPAGLQRDLDADPRMQSWLDRVFAVIDSCHAKNRSATGTIEAGLVMHENARPDADIRVLPPALSGVVACATGSLLRIKMPLFTGREGTRHVVRIRFE